MPATRRLDGLVHILTIRTEDGTLKWHPTADENTFRLSAPSANVRVTRSEEFDREAETPYTVRRLAVLNDKARVIEEYHPETIDQLAGFDSLFAEARRSAYDTDDILDKLMKDLGQED